MIPSAGDEHDPNHDAQKKERGIGEPGQLWKKDASIIRSPSVARSRLKESAYRRAGQDREGNLPAERLALPLNS